METRRALCPSTYRGSQHVGTPRVGFRVDVVGAVATDGSKHVLNAQVAVRAPCCRKFYDVCWLPNQCPECHNENETHPLLKSTELAFLCKKCRRAFRKDMTEYEPADEFCPHCDNQYVCGNTDAGH